MADPVTTVNADIAKVETALGAVKSDVAPIAAEVSSTVTSDIGFIKANLGKLSIILPVVFVLGAVVGHFVL